MADQHTVDPYACGSHAWDRILQACRQLVKKIQFIFPCNEVLTTNLWWTNYFFGSQFGCSPLQAASLMTKGLMQVQDIWDARVEDFLNWPTICAKFSLLPNDR